MNPEHLLIEQSGQEFVKIGGYILPAEDFNLARFLRDDLGVSWLHAGGIISTRQLLKELDVRPGMRVLDMGCGVGSASRFVAANTAAEVVAIDFDPEMIRRAREASGSRSNIRFEVMDVMRTTLPSNSFDRIIIQSVACFTDKVPLFREAARLLKPGGILGMNEVTWLQPPTEKVAKVMCATICETFRGALLASEWKEALHEAGLVEAAHTEYPFDASTPYQILREEGVVKTAKVMWRVFTRPEINMRLSAMSDFFKKCPEYFSYAIYTARKPEAGAENQE